jgi:hypothetical protein
VACPAPRPPEHFADPIELQAFIDATGCAYYWDGTQGFAKKQRQYGDRFIVVPVRTRRGVTMAGLLPPDIVKAENEAVIAAERMETPSLMIGSVDAQVSAGAS